MKNLKKLSVVLFATLLSFNFTSCIDDGVSDAVDQVYLAQAEFLKASGALKEAEAQFQLAQAATETAKAQLILAQAEVQLAYARQTDAESAEILAASLRADGLSDANIAKIMAEIARLDNMSAAQVAEYVAATMRADNASAASIASTMAGILRADNLSAQQIADMIAASLRADNLSAAQIAEIVAATMRANAVSEATVEGMSITNLYNAAKNAILLEEAQALADKNIQTYVLAMENAMAVHTAAMVGLTEAIAAANDAVVLELYNKYGITIVELEDLLAQEVTAMDNLANKKLFLHDGTATDPVTQLWYMNQLKSDTAALHASIAAKQASIEMYEENIADLKAAAPSDIQVQVTALDATIASIEGEIDALNNNIWEKNVEISTAWEAWQAANDQYIALEAKEGEVAAAQAIIDAHLAQQKADTAEIEAIYKIIRQGLPGAIQAVEDAKAAGDVKIAAAQDAVVTAEGGIVTAEGVITAAEGDLVVAEDALGAGVPPAVLGDEAFAPATTVNEELFNAELAVVNAQEAIDVAAALIDGGNVNNILGLEQDLMDALVDYQAYLDGIGVGMTIPELEANLVAADAEEALAQAAWEADQIGYTWFPGADGQLGDHSDDATDEATWLASGPFYTPANDGYRTYVQIDYDAILDVVNFGTESWPTTALIDANNPPLGSSSWTIPNKDFATLNAGNDGFWFNVEYDDEVVENYAWLLMARSNAYMAQTALNDAIGLEAAEGSALANAQNAILDAYIAVGALPVGSTWGGAGFAMDSDFIAIENYIAEDLTDILTAAQDALGTPQGNPSAGDDAFAPATTAYEAFFNAKLAVADAEQAVADAEAALGTVLNRPRVNYVSPADTAYKVLYNAEVKVVKEKAAKTAAVAAKQTIVDNFKDVGPADAACGDADSYKEDIACLWVEIADIEALMPSHYYALDFLRAELEKMAEDFGIDLDDPLWENNADHSDLLNGYDPASPFGWLTMDQLHDYLPLYAAYIDLRTEREDIYAAIDAKEIELMHTNWLRNSLDSNLGDGVNETVEDFDTWVLAQIDLEQVQIDLLLAGIDTALLSIEEAEVQIALGHLSQEDMENNVALCEAKLANIQAKIVLVESAATVLLDRINTALGN